MLLPVLGFAQGNGGITNENASAKIEWVGIAPTGDYIARVYNKQNCTTDMTVQWGGTARFREKSIPSGGSDTFWINTPPTPNCFLGAKPRTMCTNTADRGTVELNVCQIMPVKFSNVVGQRINSNSIRLTFTAEEDLNLKQYNIQYSLDGKTFNTVTILFPNGIEGKKTYSLIIKY